MSDKHIETVNHLKKKLDKGVSFEKTMHILHKLQKIPISFQLLEETGIGYKLRELSKQEKNNDIGKTAKLLINAWKQFLKNQQKRQEEEDDDDESEHESMNNDDHHHSYDQEYQSGNMDSDDQQQHFNGNNDDNDNDDDDDERNHYVSDNRSEESTSPNHHETINTNSNKKKHKKKKKSKSKENNLKDDDGDERKERKKDKKRKHRNDDSVGSGGGGNVIDTNNKRYRSSEISSCDNDYSQKYLNGEMMMTTPNESRCPNTKDQTSSSSRHSKTIISSSNGDDMFSSMLNMSDQVLTATATTTTTSAKHHGRNNNRMDQSSLNNDDYSSYNPYQPQQSSSSSSFDREMMQSLNASANRYDPSIYQYYQPQKSNINNDDLDKDKNAMMINMAGMKFKGRTQVYAGSSKVVTVPKVYRLQDICIKVLMNHVNKIYEVGDLPYFILKPVFAKCTVQQLRRIEHYNPQLLEDTDELWREFCEKDFKNKRMDQNKFEFWRDFYDHCLNEREQKLKNITKNINSKQRQAIPERKTQQLDAAKTPREIRRRQERNFNTPYPLSKSSTSGRAIGGGGGIKAALSSSITQISNKSKPAPLMKKLLQMRHSKFRR